MSWLQTAARRWTSRGSASASASSPPPVPAESTSCSCANERRCAYFVRLGFRSELHDVVEEIVQGESDPNALILLYKLASDPTLSYTARLLRVHDR